MGLHTSSVQSTPSEQLALSQHSRQLVPPQQSWPVGQPVYVHCPFEHATVWHARGAQSDGDPQVPLGTHAFAAASQRWNSLQVVCVKLQAPAVQRLTVHATLSLHSDDAQHAPQVPVPGQQRCPVAHGLGVFRHVPASHLSTVHGSLSAHCESAQHAAQPLPGQQVVPVGQLSLKHLPSVQRSVVHGLASSQRLTVLAVHEARV